MKLGFLLVRLVDNNFFLTSLPTSLLTTILKAISTFYPLRADVQKNIMALECENSAAYYSRTSLCSKSAFVPIIKNSVAPDTLYFSYLYLSFANQQDLQDEISYTKRILLDLLSIDLLRLFHIQCPAMSQMMSLVEILLIGRCLMCMDIPTLGTYYYEK